MIYGKVQISAMDHWRILVEHVVACEELRKAFRQKIKVEGQIAQVGEEEKRVPCILEDISVVGVGFHAPAELEEGEPITLRIPRLTDQGKGYEILCKVAVRVASEENGCWRYGCSFERLDEQTEGRLLKEILILQAKSMSREKV